MGPRRLAETPDIHATADVSDSRLGPFCEIKEGCRLLNVVMGAYSYADRFADLANVDIGKFVNIASFVRINPGDHPMERASLHHFMYRASMYWPDADDEPEIFKRRAAKAVQIGHDVWFGHGAVVLAGRRVGNGAVIGAGAVVAKDVPAFEVWAGNPARKIRDRHPPDVAARLTALAWWDWDHARLRGALDDFRRLSARAFLQRYEDS